MKHPFAHKITGVLIELQMTPVPDLIEETVSLIYTKIMKEILKKISSENDKA
jgi:hypothetical protein